MSSDSSQLRPSLMISEGLSEYARAVGACRMMKFPLLHTVYAGCSVDSMQHSSPMQELRMTQKPEFSTISRDTLHAAPEHRVS